MGDHRLGSLHESLFYSEENSGREASAVTLIDVLALPMKEALGPLDPASNSVPITVSTSSWDAKVCPFLTD